MNNIMFNIAVPIICAVIGSLIGALIYMGSFKKERKRFKREHIISINNDMIKDYREFFMINKKLKAFADKIKNRTIPNWINVESYYRDEFISEVEEVLTDYEFMGSYIEDKEIIKKANNILKISRGILKELKERENFGSTSDEVEGKSEELINRINGMEKSILERVTKLSEEKNKLVNG